MAEPGIGQAKSQIDSTKSRETKEGYDKNNEITVSLKFSVTCHR